MLKRFLVVAAYLVASLAAYSVPGAYERMFFWYAYLADRQVHGTNGNLGDSTNIAPGCKNCDFNQFVKYISSLSETPNISSDMYPDVDKTAQALNAAPDGKYTGRYDPNLVSSGNPGKSIPLLFEQVSSFIGSNSKNIPSKTLAAARDSIARVQFHRAWANSDAIDKKLTAKYPGGKWIYITKYPYSGAPGKDFLSVEATANANPDKPDIRDIAKGVTDSSHRNNIFSAMQARARVQGCFRTPGT